jgi:hypothetical protein
MDWQAKCLISSQSGSVALSPMLRTLFLLTALALSACSKVEVQPATNNVTLSPVISAPSAPYARQQSSQSAGQDRLVEIDRLLSAPLTGSKADADQRVTLRAERDVLTGKANVTASRNPAPVVASRGNSPQQVPQIVVARDSRAENGNLSFLEQMTPTERERYFKSRRIENPRPVIYYAPRRP